MLIQGQNTYSIKFSQQPGLSIELIDQRQLPHQVVWEKLSSSEEVAVAIEEMHLRGAPLIGAAAAFGVAFAIKESLDSSNFDQSLAERVERLSKTRPTAINLSWAIAKVMLAAQEYDSSEKVERSWEAAKKIMTDDIEQCKQIGLHGVDLIRDLWKKNQRTINILTHCNAGWLACLEWGTATSPIYHAHKEGIPVHVWVDETRPRNQGAKLTAFELEQQGVPYSVITDNTGGHLMQHGMVDIVLVGSDRTTISGDVANKIGTYLKALAAKDNNVPFYVALPSSTFDFTISNGLKEIPIEERASNEVKLMDGLHDNQLKSVLITPKNANASNYGFDVTPARLVTGLITERGIVSASKESIVNMFPEFLNP